jgi:hypothetical protein
MPRGVTTGGAVHLFRFDVSGKFTGCRRRPQHERNGVTRNPMEENAEMSRVM